MQKMFCSETKIDAHNKNIINKTMENSIILPSCISHLNEIKIETLEEAMKFELLMEIYKKKTYLEISNILEQEETKQL